MPNIHNKTYITTQLASAADTAHALAIDASDNVTITPTTIEAPPVQTNPSTSTSGGTLPNTTQFFTVITATDAHGAETAVSNEKSVTTGTGSNSNTYNWTNPTGTVFNTVYRGLTTGTEKFLIKIAAALTYVDANAVAIGTANPPASAKIGPPVAHTGISAAYGDVAKADAVMQLVTDGTAHRTRPTFH